MEAAGGAVSPGAEPRADLHVVPRVEEGVPMTGRNDPGSASPPTGRRVRVQRYLLVIVAVLAGAVCMILLSALMAPERQDDIWVELAKSAATILSLALATGVVGAMLRDRDALREDQRRQQAYLLGFLEQIEATYGQVKSARRMLRTFGFDSPTTQTLTAEQATGFRAQMALLNEAELAFETQARKVTAMPGTWGAAGAPLTTELTRLYQYLHRVLTEWQTDPTVFVAGGDTSAMKGWSNFCLFVGYDEVSIRAFEESVTGRMLAIELLIGAADKPAPHALLQPHRDDASATFD